MIAKHFNYENYKPETLMDPFNEAAAIWKKNGATRSFTVASSGR